MSSSNQLRNHPSVIIEQTLYIVFILFLVFFSIVGDTEYAYFVFVLAALALIVAYVFWKKTYIIFKEDELVIERNLLQKTKKTIPYHKIASVNIERKVLNRIFKTSALKISINSGVNSTVPEASLTFEEDIALKIRADLSSKLFNHTYSQEEDESTESLIHFTPIDIVLHSIFGMPTSQSILAAFLIVTSLISVFYEGSALYISLIFFAVVEVIPAFLNILKFYNFKVYRKDNSIHLQHGMIQTYRFSFNTSRVNAVKIKRTFFARVFLHRASIEVEVVGLRDSDGKTPTICLLIDEKKIQNILCALLPEYTYDHNLNKQPPAAKRPLLANATIYSSITVVILFAAWYILANQILLEHQQLFLYVVLALSIGLVAIYFAMAHFSYKIVEYDIGKDLFTYVNGVVDRETSILSYDRVQVVKLSSGPVARRVGLSRCNVSLLSSIGNMTISSGYFPTENLSKIADRVLERIATGEYDYRTNGI